MSSLIEKFKNKKICLLGFGIENQALLDYLIKKKIECEIVVCDAYKETKDSVKKLNFKKTKISWCLGEDYDKNLNKFDIVSRIAGYPLFTREIKKAIKANIEITNPIKLFFELSPTKNIVGVTGTKGKGTTSGLIFKIIEATGKCVYWGGNIGIPVFSFFDKLKKDDWVVLELASFQLEDLNTSPHMAVITNLGREHLAPADPQNPNYHKTLKGYLNSKFNIIKFQKKNNFAIMNRKIKSQNLTSGRGKLNLGRGTKIYFDKENMETRLIGEHNQENIAAAKATAKAIGIRESLVRKVVKNYKGLEHRLEFCGEARGVKYYDDSFATTPESAITAIRSFSEPIIMMLGGSDKASNFKKLAKEVLSRVKFVILIDGVATKRIKKELLRVGYSSNNMTLVFSMKEVVKEASKKAQDGDIVLMSPACASFGIFKNYKERGDLFKKEVKKLRG